MANFFNAQRLLLLELLLEDLNQGVIVCNKEGRIILYNTAYSKIDNMSQDDVMGNIIEDNYLMKKGESTLRQVMRTKKPILTHRQQYTTISGATVDVLKDTYPIIDEGDVIGAYSIVYDFYNAKILANEILQKVFEEAFQKQNATRINFSKIAFKSKEMLKNVRVIDDARNKFRNIAIFSHDGAENEELVTFISKKINLAVVYFNCASVEEEQEYIFFGNDNTDGIIKKINSQILVLENIDYLTTKVQLKLKEYLSETSVKIITIFNKTQDKIILDKKIQLELFYKLNEISLTIPSLNERKEDISVYITAICKYLSTQNSKEISVSSDAYKILLRYNWPGNFLELFYTLKTASYSNDHIEKKDLPLYILNFCNVPQATDSSFSSLNEILDFTEKETIQKALEENKYNISKTAKELGISRQNLQYRIKKFSF